jgi:hypothetical protein
MKKTLKLLISVALLSVSSLSADTDIDVAALASVEGKEVSTYLRGAYMDATTAKSKLESAGYTIVGEYNFAKNGTTILFTDSALKSEASKPNRGYVALERLYVDDTNKKITITNPIYFGKAYMQKEYSHEIFYKEFKTLMATFAGLKASEDKLKFNDLEGYHYMMGMPYYQDMLKLGSGADLIAKAKQPQSAESIVFELKISDNATLLGFDFDRRTNKFPSKIGLENALVMPYVILVENTNAKALSGYYYIALSYPLLSMAQFTKIADAPGAIETFLAKPFE